jgi:hypothetical protein
MCSAVVIGALAGVVGNGALAQPELPHPGLSALTPVGAFLLHFDENGNATIQVGTAPATPLIGALMNDPTLPIGSPPQNVLTYLLPEPVVSGTVEIPEPAADGGGISDALRFTDATGIIDGGATGAGTRLIYYSDLVPGDPDDNALADTGFPINLTAGNFFIGPTEVGPEGNNGFDYQPAGVPFPADNEYIGISDATLAPEPASLALLGSAFAAMGFWVRRRRR